MWVYPSDILLLKNDKMQKKNNQSKEQSSSKEYTVAKKTKQFWFKNEIANPYITFGPLIKKIFILC